MLQTRLRRKSSHTIYIQIFFFVNLAFYEIMWKDIVERPQMTTWNMRVACWIHMATDTHTHNVSYLFLYHCNNGHTNARFNVTL